MHSFCVRSHTISSTKRCSPSRQAADVHQLGFWFICPAQTCHPTLSRKYILNRHECVNANRLLVRDTYLVCETSRVCIPKAQAICCQHNLERIESLTRAQYHKADTYHRVAVVYGQCEMPFAILVAQPIDSAATAVQWSSGIYRSPIPARTAIP
jgi:hypothetical protein